MDAGIDALVAIVDLRFRICSVRRVMLQVKRVSQITLLCDSALDGIPGIIHAFSTRRAEHNEFTLGASLRVFPAGRF